MFRSLFCRSLLTAFALVPSACSSDTSQVDGAGAPGVSGGASAGKAGEASGVAGRSDAAGGGVSTGGQSAIGGAASSGAGGTNPSASGASGATAGSAGSGNQAGATASGGAPGGAGAAGAAGGAGSGALPSTGCRKAPTLKNNGYNSITSGGKSRQYYLRLPTNYDNAHAYRLILGLHGATNKATDVAPGFFGLYDLSQGSTVFIAPDASDGLWSAQADTTFVDDILKAVKADLCIDTNRVELEGFSQGAAMAWTLACSRPKVFRAVVGHSGGGVPNPTTCQPIPYFGSLGLSEGGGQKTQTDQFAKFNGCTIESLPSAATGGHSCTDYKGCAAGYPVRWCSYDGGHTPSPKDAGKGSSWMPSEVWPFLSQF